VTLAACYSLALLRRSALHSTHATRVPEPDRLPDCSSVRKGQCEGEVRPVRASIRAACQSSIVRPRAKSL